MSQNIGTLVSSAIRPNDSLDQIASAFANEIKGGAHGYETYDDMNNIIEARREWGMLVTVYNDSDSDLNGTYQLKYGNTNNNVFDILDNSNWVKLNLGDNASTEWVDSVISILSIEPTLEPFPGDRYLLATIPNLLPSGTNWDNYSYGTIIVEYSNIGTWKLTIPTNGMTVRVDNDDNSIYKYEGNYPTGIWKQEKTTQVFYIEPTSIGGLTYSVSTDPIFNAYSRDLIFLTKFNTANTGTASININGLGYRNIKIATKNGVRDLIISDIVTNGIYSLTYNGTYFQMTKPFPSDSYNIEYYIGPGEVVTVQEYEQYWVYGDLTIDGGVMQNYGHVVVANGSVNLVNSGVFNNNGSGELILVDLFNTPIFNTTDTIQLSSVMTINGPSVSAIVLNNSLTPSHINSVNTATASWILSNNGSSFEWVLSTSVSGTVSQGVTGATGPQGATGSPGEMGATGAGVTSSFYLKGTSNYSYDTTSDIYRTGSINIGTGTATDGRFVVSSSGGTVSFIVDELGSIYNGFSNLRFGYNALKVSLEYSQVNDAYDIQNGSGYTDGTYSVTTYLYSGPPLIKYPVINVNVSAGQVYFQSVVSNGSGYIYNGSQTELTANIPGGSGYRFKILVTESTNTAIGNYSLSSNTTGENNIAIGYQSLYSNIISGSNVAIGNNTLTLNTGSSNTAIGYNSLYNNTTGYYNIGIGHRVLYFNQTGHHNTSIGAESLFYNINGSYNTSLGYGAGTFISGSTSNTTNSNNSLFIGNDTRPQLDNQTNQIVIGHGATGNGSNTATLGNNDITKTYLKGTINGDSFVKNGGTSSQYLMADGSTTIVNRLFNFSSNTYQTVSGTVSATSSEISSSMFGTGDVLRVQSIITLSAASTATASISYFINSTASLIGATQIATYDGPVGNRFIWTDRNFWSVGGTFNSRNFGNSSQTSVSNSSASLGSVAIPSTFYILVTAKTTGTDLACISSVVIQKL